MASRKEDEKNERTIRGLLKLPENKRCINCNSLGPQYVCTTFWTFVCTNCSGIHREFTHRVKSVSMAKFTSQEVSALQEGGNQRAREIYFKGFDPQRQSSPDGSNVERLREFIRHVYVNKRYAGERNDDKSSMGKMGDKEDFHESRSPSGSRSPPYENTYERRYSDRSSPGQRSPGFEPKHDDRKSPSRTEFVNDWRRDDRFGSGRKSEEEGRSPEQVKDLGAASPPVVRPVREILGDHIVPLRVQEPPKANFSRAPDGSGHTKKTASSSSLASLNENPREVKLETTVSLIDFDADDPQPPVAASAATQVQKSATIPQPVLQPTTSSANDNWASFDVAPNANVSQAPSNANTLDSLLSQLSVPASVPQLVQTSGLPSGPGSSMDAAAFQAKTPTALAENNNTVSPFGAGNHEAPVSSFSSVPTGGILPGQWPNVQQQQPSLFPGLVSHSTAQHFAPPQNGPTSNQPWNASLASNVQRSLSAPTLERPQGVSKPFQEITSTGMQPSSVGVKSTGRMELPEDLFTATYPSYHATVAGWQAVPPRGMGFGLHNGSAATPFPTFQQPAKSMNPFDFGNDTPPQNQTATEFPSMASLQGALPNMLPPSGIMRTTSLGSVSQAGMPSHALLPHQIPYQQPPGHPSAMLPISGYISPQMPSNMPPSHLSSFSNMGASYGTQNINQQLAGPYPGPPGPHSSHSGGNPFG